MSHLLLSRNIEDGNARTGGGAGGHHRPANTLVQAQLVGEEYLVEVEVSAPICWWCGPVGRRFASATH